MDQCRWLFRFQCHIRLEILLHDAHRKVQEIAFEVGLVVDLALSGT